MHHIVGERQYLVLEPTPLYLQMCLILVAHDYHSEYRHIVATNRDEFYERPATAAAPWPEDPRIIGGRDLRAGGSWFSVRRDGRWAAVTNVHDFRTEPDDDARSRGDLIRDFLLSDTSPAEYLQEISGHAQEFNGFNLLVSDGADLYWYSNRADEGARRLDAGIYGLSNDRLDTPWPKVVRGKKRLTEALDADEPDPDELFDLLDDRDVPPDESLPDTGASRELERTLAPAFITGEKYGTRMSTVLLMKRDGGGDLYERTFGSGGTFLSEVQHEL